MFSGMFDRHRRIVGFISVALLAFATPALAQLRGKVIDEQGRPVAGATIEVTSVSESVVGFVVQQKPSAGSVKRQARTNDNGDYMVGVLASGVYMVAASKEGVGTDATQVALEFGKPATANLRLRSAAPARMAGRCASSTAKGADPSPLTAGGDPALTRFVRWLVAVHLHVGGCSDSLAIEIGKWSRGELETLLRDVRELVKFLQRTEAERSEFAGRQQRDQLIFFIYNRRFTLDELERNFYGENPLIPNAVLKRGAVLHADIAEFVPGNLGAELLADDGARRGWRSGTLHWEIGRQLIDSVTPSPTSDAGALLWYRAVSAHLLREGRLGEVSAHLNKATQIFPDSPIFQVDSGYLHEELSSSAIQAAVRELRDHNVNVSVGSRIAELQQAERFFRQALSIAPENADARLRLGRTLGELGRHEEAVAELRRAIDAKPDEQRLYLAELFLGREEEALGRYEEAQQRFDTAAVLYPTAQSPRLALGRLARQSGDRAGALRAVRSIAARASSDNGADPWWSYYEPHKQDAEALMDQMWKRLASIDGK